MKTHENSVSWPFMAVFNGGSSTTDDGMMG